MWRIKYYLDNGLIFWSPSYIYGNSDPEKETRKTIQKNINWETLLHLVNSDDEYVWVSPKRLLAFEICYKNGNNKYCKL